LSLPDISSLQWRIEPEGLALGTLLRISFQRCVRPSDGVHYRSPSSLGALPLFACGFSEFLLPIAEDEAVWLGLSTPNAQAPVQLLVKAKTDSQGMLNAYSGRPWQEDNASHRSFLGISTIDGIYRDDQTVWAFQRCAPTPESPACERLSLQARQHPPRQGEQVSQEAMVRFVDYAVFEGAAGYVPPPLDRDAGYGGWLLP
jgi:hypothetical protein